MNRSLGAKLLTITSLAWVVALIGSACLAAEVFTEFEFLGEARLPGGLVIEGTVVGGLSGMTYDRDRDLYYVVSDDPSARSPARFYTIEIDLDQGRLERGGVQVTEVTEIEDRSGEPMQKLTVDPEGIALLDQETLFISSEGQVERGVAPFVRRFSLDGNFETEVDLPDRYLPDRSGSRGPRQNFGFESLALTPDGKTLFTALENALIQDGARATTETPSPGRLLEIDASTGELRAEYLYMSEPVAAPSTVPDGLEVAGLVELLAIDSRSLLSMERSFSMGSGNTVRLYRVDTEGATDVSALAALNAVDLESIRPVHKDLLFDLADLDIYIDNLEGMTFGPRLADGRRTMILVADDNFNPLVQVTQFLAFAVGTEKVDIDRIQGAAHRSPLEGRWVNGVEGVVTAMRPAEDLEFWIEDPEGDDDPATSSGLLVTHPMTDLDLHPGDAVVVAGVVKEDQRPGELSRTSIEASRIRRVGQGRSLPSPVELHEHGRRVPAEVIDDDGLRHFEPEFDGLDFWESLEGMRITVADARVVGPTNRYGDLTIDASQGDTVAGRTAVGGLVLQPGDLNPERLVVRVSEAAAKPVVDVGARFVGDLNGIVDYAFGRFRLYALPPLPRIDAPRQPTDTTELRSADDHLTIATFNVMNLSARDRADRFSSVARTLVDGLGSPDIVALQEIQDDSGKTDDAIVEASGTLARLIGAIGAAGGPAYQSRTIDPRDHQDGGLPGANIRVAFLFNPLRVEVRYRGKAGPDDAVQGMEPGEGAILSLSPGRLMPLAPAFAGDGQRGFSPSRKPLAAEFQFGTERLVVINNHWASKRVDSSTFGEPQPPIRASEDQRSQQARLVTDFVRQLEAWHPEVGVVVLGDFNEHEFRTPLRILAAGGLENLVYRLPPEDRYTFNFNGNSQMLDHIFVSERLLSRAEAHIDIVHRNADLAHSKSSSDHDPLVVQLDFSPRP